MQILTEGKTKIIELIGDGIVRVHNKDDITAGDGKKHDILESKSVLATETTSNIFSFLRRCGYPVAFIERDSPTTFTAPACRMLPFEVVVRAEAYGSYLERHPEIIKGTALGHDLVAELYLKTKNRRWGKFTLDCDDPLMRIRESGHIELYNPHKVCPIGTHFLLLRPHEVYEEQGDGLLLDQMMLLAKSAFLLLRLTWKRLGFNYVDYKVEFGIGPDGKLFIADSIDNDSGRLLEGPKHLDKQGYREGDDLVSVGRDYKRVAELTRQFLTIPLLGSQSTA